MCDILSDILMTHECCVNGFDRLFLIAAKLVVEAEIKQEKRSLRGKSGNIAKNSVEKYRKTSFILVFTIMVSYKAEDR